MTDQQERAETQMVEYGARMRRQRDAAITERIAGVLNRHRLGVQQ